MALPVKSKAGPVFKNNARLPEMFPEAPTAKENMK